MQEEEQEFLYQQIGGRIQELRKDARMSQAGLAKLLKLSRTSIVNMEKGRQHPSIHLLIDISRIFKVSISQLLDDALFADFNQSEKLKVFKRKIAKSEIKDFDPQKILGFIKKEMSQNDKS